MSTAQGLPYVPGWSNTLIIVGITLSMAVNALATGLMVIRIFKVFQEVKTANADDQNSGVTGENTLRRVIFIIIESGMALFSIQLTRLVVGVVVSLVTTDASYYNAYLLIVCIHEMLNVIMTINHCYVILLIK